MASDAELPDVGQRARRRIARRLLPFLFVLYIVAFLDRVNIGYAGLEMSHDLGFSDRVFGLGAGIFFLGYCLFDIPGALIVERWSARKWIARILLTWGIITIFIGAVHTPKEFYAGRFLLGAAEAGFFPGIIVYLMHWFRQEDRARAAAMFMSAIPVSNIIASPFAGWLLGVHWYGLHGWRWLFVLEGIPAIVFGLITLGYLTDWPQQAKWLPRDEQEWITGELQREKEAKSAKLTLTVWEALRRKEVLLLTLVYFLAVTNLYGFGIWFPTILQRATGLPNLAVTLIAALPYIGAFVVMLWIGWHSDKTGERRWHTAAPLFICGAFLAIAIGFRSNVWVALAALIMAGAFSTAFIPSFWSLPTALLGGSAAAAAVGLINSVGNLGGFAGPYAMGYLNLHTHSTAAGLLFLLIALFLGGAAVLRMKAPRI
jgi:ACS family tartrate transporter-like MFS transporter